MKPVHALTLASLVATGLPQRLPAQTFIDDNWSALGSGINGSVYALAVSGSDLYAAGVFTTAGGVTVSNVAKWNGSSWSALGSGMAGGSVGGSNVQALAVSGADLYAGGNFTTAGGVTVGNVAKWNGSSWSALGSGVSGFGAYTFVSALAMSGTNLYAGAISRRLAESAPERLPNGTGAVGRPLAWG